MDEASNSYLKTPPSATVQNAVTPSKRIINKIPLDFNKLKQAGLDRQLAEALSKNNVVVKKNIASATTTTSSSASAPVVTTIATAIAFSAPATAQATALQTSAPNSTKAQQKQRERPPVSVTIKRKNPNLVAVDQQSLHVKAMIKNKILKKTTQPSLVQQSPASTLTKREIKSNEETGTIESSGTVTLPTVKADLNTRIKPLLLNSVNQLPKHRATCGIPCPQIRQRQHIISTPAAADNPFPKPLIVLENKVLAPNEKIDLSALRLPDSTSISVTSTKSPVNINWSPEKLSEMAKEIRSKLQIPNAASLRTKKIIINANNLKVPRDQLALLAKEICKQSEEQGVEQCNIPANIKPTYPISSNIITVNSPSAVLSAVKETPKELMPESSNQNMSLTVPATDTPASNRDDKPLASSSCATQSSSSDVISAVDFIAQLTATNAIDPNTYMQLSAEEMSLNAKFGITSSPVFPKFKDNEELTPVDCKIEQDSMVEAIPTAECRKPEEELPIGMILPMLDMNILHATVNVEKDQTNVLCISPNATKLEKSAHLEGIHDVENSKDLISNKGSATLKIMSNAPILVVAETNKVAQKVEMAEIEVPKVQKKEDKQPANRIPIRSKKGKINLVQRNKKPITSIANNMTSDKLSEKPTIQSCTENHQVIQEKLVDNLTETLNNDILQSSTLTVESYNPMGEEPASKIIVNENHHDNTFDTFLKKQPQEAENNHESCTAEDQRTMIKENITRDLQDLQSIAAVRENYVRKSSMEDLSILNNRSLTNVTDTSAKYTDLAIDKINTSEREIIPVFSSSERTEKNDTKEIQNRDLTQLYHPPKMPKHKYKVLNKSENNNELTSDEATEVAAPTVSILDILSQEPPLPQGSPQLPFRSSQENNRLDSMPDKSAEAVGIQNLLTHLATENVVPKKKEDKTNEPLKPPRKKLIKTRPVLTTKRPKSLSQTKPPKEENETMKTEAMHPRKRALLAESKTNVTHRTMTSSTSDDDDIMFHGFDNDHPSISKRVDRFQGNETDISDDITPDNDETEEEPQSGTVSVDKNEKTDTEMNNDKFDALVKQVEVTVNHERLEQMGKASHVEGVVTENRIKDTFEDPDLVSVEENDLENSNSLKTVNEKESVVFGNIDEPLQTKVVTHDANSLKEEPVIGKKKRSRQGCSTSKPAEITPITNRDSSLDITIDGIKDLKRRGKHAKKSELTAPSDQASLIELSEAPPDKSESESITNLSVVNADSESLDQKAQGNKRQRKRQARNSTPKSELKDKTDTPTSSVQRSSILQPEASTNKPEEEPIKDLPVVQGDSGTPSVNKRKRKRQTRSSTPKSTDVKTGIVTPTKSHQGSIVKAEAKTVKDCSVVEVDSEAVDGDTPLRKRRRKRREVFISPLSTNAQLKNEIATLTPSNQNPRIELSEMSTVKAEEESESLDDTPLSKRQRKQTARGSTPKSKNSELNAKMSIPIKQEEMTAINSAKKKNTEENSNLLPTITPTPKRRGRQPIKRDPVDEPLGPEYWPPTSGINLRMLLISKREQLTSEEDLREDGRGEGSLQCGFCLVRCKDSNWNSHIGEHYGVGWPIDQPPAYLTRFVLIAQMTKYLKSGNGNIRLQCRLCDRQLGSGLGMLLHLEGCGAEQQRIECEHCKKLYSQSYLPQHIRQCSIRMVPHGDDEAATKASTEDDSNEIIFSNAGRAKRKSTIKAETNLGKIAAHLKDKDDESGNKHDFKGDSSDYDMTADKESSEEYESEGVDSNEDDVNTEGEDVDVKPSKGKQGKKPKLIKSSKLPSSGSSKPIFQRIRKLETLSKQRWKYFINVNYSKSMLYPHLLPCYEELLPAEASKLLPSKESNSMRYAYENAKNVNVKDWIQLAPLEGFGKESEHLCYLGGPIKELAWVPLPSTVSNQYLLCSRRTKMLDYARQMTSKQEDALLLLLECTLSPDQRNINMWPLQTRLYYGICVSEGPVHTFALMPSGGYDENTNRLGLLALGTTTTVAIYALPLKLSDNSNDQQELAVVIKLQAVITLTLDIENPLQDPCTKLCWSESAGHSFLVTGYASGHVAFWDIADEDGLNFMECENKRHFVPVHYFYFGERNIRHLDLHYDTNGARWLSVGAFARKLWIYDIANRSQPLAVVGDNIHNLHLTAVNWPTMWESLAVGCNSLYMSQFARIVSFNPTAITYGHSRLDTLITTPRSIHFNSDQLALVTCNDNGDVVFLHSGQFHMEPLLLKRVPNMRTVCSTDACYLNEASEPSSISPDEFTQDYGLLLKPMIDIPQEKRTSYMDVKRRPNFELGNLMRFNCVRWNWNEPARNWVAAGAEHGLLRIINFVTHKHFEYL